jgi:DNA repair protein RadD
MIELRPYQHRAMEQLMAWFEANPTGHPVVEAAVGAGKSVLIAELCRRALQYPHTRVLMCVASRELCRQNAEKLLNIWPDAPLGIYSAGLKSKTLGTPILFATIASVWKRWADLGDISLLLVDECHQISARDEGMYRSLIANLLRMCPHMRVIGWTGTAYHGDGVWLTDAVEPLFTDIAARVSMRALLDEGYLAPLVTPRTEARLSAEGVGMRGGDFIVSQLAKAIDKTELVEQCAEELVRLGAERKKWLVYGATVAHAHHIADALGTRGIACAVISAKTPHPERDAALAGLRAGRLRALVNVATLTTGIDIPEVDLIALLRNTRSPVLMVQIAGRGMRIAPGKVDTLFVDFTDTLAVLGPVDLLRGRRRKAAPPGDAVTKICEACGARNAAAARECSQCGAPFEIEEKPRHNVCVSEAAALSTEVTPRHERHEVVSVEYRPWPGRNGNPPTLRVDYRGAFMRFASEWVCLEHEGYARTRAVQWWLRRCQGHRVPRTVDDALAQVDGLFKPAALTLNVSKKYPEIVGYEWTHPTGSTGSGESSFQGDQAPAAAACRG